MAYELKPRAPKSVAMVRAGEEAHLYGWCRDNGYVTIGWFGKPPVDLGGWTMGQLEARFREQYPTDDEAGGKGAYRKRSSQSRGLGNVADFMFNLPKGRRVMIASPGGGSTILLGEVTGSYEFHPDWDITERYDPYCHFKPVRWIGEFARSELVEAAGLPWSDQSTVWWVEDLGAIRDLESAAAAHPLSGAKSPSAVSGGSASQAADESSPPLARLHPLTDRQRIEEAFERFRQQLTDGISPVKKAVGWRGGWDEFDVYWRAGAGFWFLLESERTETRYWCCFGPEDPDAEGDLSITCEINFAFEGVNRRIAGAFLEDDDGRVFVAHSGKIGGGKEGVGKTAFLEYLDSPLLVEVEWPDEKLTKMLVLGMLDSPSLVSGIATFVSEAADFKAAVHEGTTGERELHDNTPEDVDSALGDYFPESLLGQTNAETKRRTIEMRLAHGPVVHALRDEIETAGLLAKKNNRIDLAAVTTSGQLVTIFEVKTATDWGSIYGAIGQLMYYGKSGAHTPKRLVAVLPEGGPADLGSRLGAIGIDVVRYRYVKGRPVFDGVDAALRTT